MDAWLKPFVFALAGLGALPFALAHLLFTSARYDNEQARLKKVLLPGILLNLLGCGACGYAAAALLFHTRAPWKPLLRLLRLQGSWQDLSSLALLAAACAAAGIAAGLLLRRLLLGKDRFPVSAGRRAAALILCAVCGGMAFFACAESVRANSAVTISEVCRKTAVYVIDPDREESLGDNGREISYVVLSNSGPLDCVFDILYLSESEEDPTALPFRDVTVPARGACRLTMDWEHGLDLKKGGGSAVYLCSRADTVLDRVTVPALQEHEAWCLSPDTGEWSVHTYAARIERSLEAPVFSRESGFYAEGFDLALSGPEGAEIYYTLDGSDPSSGGTRYTGPLRVEDPTPSANVWSARTDVTASFTAGVDRYTVPDGPVDKCAVVSAVCVNADGEMSPVATASYFIGFDGRKGYGGLGFASVVTDPSNLFDDKTGIYVLGKTFREKHPSDREDLGWWWWSANFHQKGRGWEREASVTFFDPEHRLQFSSRLGIRVKGGASAGHLPKGLNLYARKLYSGRSVIGADLFGDGYDAKRLSLSAGGNDVNLKVKDWLTSRLLEGTDLPVIRNRFLPYCVFLDGEYWGNYWLIEQYDASYFAYYYGLSKENVVVIKNGSAKSGLQEDKALLTDLLRSLRKADLSRPESYETLCGQIDMENCAAYYALQMYVANEDRGLNKNILLWRARLPEDAPAGDTRWRFALFDVNHNTCYGDASADTLAVMRKKDELFDLLMASPEFSRAFYDTLRRLATEVFTPERTEEALAEFTALMEEPLALEHQRFNRHITDLDALDKIRTFIRDRRDCILDLCAAQDALRNTEKE